MTISDYLADIGAGVSGETALFLTTFTTLVAIINPFEALPIYLGLVAEKDPAERRRVAAASCLYALGLILFFLLFGAAVLKVFGISLSMVRIAGGIVLTRIGFDLFAPQPGGGATLATAGGSDNIAFMPLAIPLMCGPGAIATVLGMMATIRSSHNETLAFGAILGATILAIFVTYLCLLFASGLERRLGRVGIDAATRIVGFFVSAMGVSLVFDGVIEALETRGMTSLR
jgi:multiple antibiotic resistance protein